MLFKRLIAMVRLLSLLYIPLASEEPLVRPAWTFQARVARTSLRISQRTHPVYRLYNERLYVLYLIDDKWLILFVCQTPKKSHPAPELIRCFPGAPGDLTPGRGKTAASCEPAPRGWPSEYSRRPAILAQGAAFRPRPAPLPRCC